MPSFETLRRTICAINFIAPLVPALALVIHSRASGRYRFQPWMTRLSVLVVFVLAENWSLLATAMAGVHNVWLANLWFVPEVALVAWTMNGIGPHPVPVRLLGMAGLVVLLGVGWEAGHHGFQSPWSLSRTVSNLFLLGLSFWQLYALITQEEVQSPWTDPAYWFLSAWSLLLISDLLFYPLQNLFLRTLSRDWILVPWTALALVGLLLNVALARTYLCPKSS